MKKLNNLLEEMDRLANAIAAMKAQGWTVTKVGEDAYNLVSPAKEKVTNTAEEIMTWYERTSKLPKQKYDLLRK